VQEASSSSMPNQRQTENETEKSRFKTLATASCKTPEKLVFGSNAKVPKTGTSTKVSVISSNLFGAKHTFFHSKSLLFNDMIYEFFFY